MAVRGWRGRRPGEIFLLESQEWERCAVVADKAAFALAVGMPPVLSGRDAALDLEYYYH